MPERSRLEGALAGIVRDLSAQGSRFALVGGLAVSLRAEVRFTRDVDLAVIVRDDAEAEQLIHALSGIGYRAIATVEPEARHRLATVRLLSPTGVKVDLLLASSGIEDEIVSHARVVQIPDVGGVPVARSEDLLAMKVLSMTDRRLQDRLDAQRLLISAPEMDLSAVRRDLQLIMERGFAREQDLHSKLAALIAEVARPTP